MFAFFFRFYISIFQTSQFILIHFLVIQVTSHRKEHCYLYPHQASLTNCDSESEQNLKIVYSSYLKHEFSSCSKHVEIITWITLPKARILQIKFCVRKQVPSTLFICFKYLIFRKAILCQSTYSRYALPGGNPNKGKKTSYIFSL